MHPKTHLFTKIKVPLSYLGQNHQVSEPWYPGDSMAEWPALKSSLKKQLATESGFDDLTVQVFYDQFECKANVHYPEVCNRSYLQALRGDAFCSVQSALV